MPRLKVQTAHLMSSPDDVEAQFYDALREADLDKLMALWHDDDEVVCVHPGGARVVGPRAIRAAFEAIFSNGAIPVQADKVRRVQALGAAIHSVVERFMISTAEGQQSGTVLATNVYVKTAQGWRMAAHHASPAAPGEPNEIIDVPSVLH